MKKERPGVVTLDVDTSVYPKEVVEAAGYGFTDRAYVRLSRPEKGRLAVSLEPKAAMAEDGLRALEGEFQDELLHQSLRQRVSEFNQKIRDFIVTKALVSAQPASQPAAAEGAPQPGTEAPCPECAQTQASPGVVDEELEKEIEKLLAEIEKGSPEGDPLGVAVPWEDKPGAGKAPEADKPQAGPSGQEAK